MIILLASFPFVLGLALLVTRYQRRRVNAKLRVTPLGGFDTGVRSAYRVPGLFKPRRGF